MKRHLRLAAGLVAVFWGHGPADAQPRKLSGPEIIKLLSGHTLVSPPGKDQSAQSFSADGITVYQSADKKLQGRWKVVGDTYCSVWDENSQPKCADVFVDPPAVAFVGADGTRNVLVPAK